jgi:rubrerythrin
MIRKKTATKASKKPARKPAPKPARSAKPAKAKAAPKKKEAPVKPPARKEAPPKPAPKAVAAQPAKPAKPGAKARKKAAPAHRAEPASREAKPGLGFKWVCFQCNAKFYDLEKPDPVCPRCGADQRSRPPVQAGPPAPPAPRRAAAPPMARYLDDEDAVPEGEAIVDEGEEEAAEIDIEAIEETGTFLEPDYEDE